MTNTQTKTNLPVLRVSKNAIMPDNAQWKNRFQVPSASSNKLYTIAQRKSDASWGCSCMGWIRHRNCKHLKSVGLPCFCAPYEIKLEAK